MRLNYLLLQVHALHGAQLLLVLVRAVCVAGGSMRYEPGEALQLSGFAFLLVAGGECVLLDSKNSEPWSRSHATPAAAHQSNGWYQRSLKCQGCSSPLEATQGQIDGFFSQLPHKMPPASVGD